MPLTAGVQLGSYRIVEPIGKGGMGEVYRAHDPRVDRDVAIKVLPEELAADPERRTRFEREARMLAALEHPNVAALYGFEEATLDGDSISFLVMQLVGGETLAEILERGPLPWRAAVPLFDQLADGLKAAHESGIVHRDLKPANLKVNEEGLVKILDFGLARSEGDSNGSSSSHQLTQSPTLTAATAAGVLLGTAAYMSPEQARGKRVDRRTDIWAFGCCLWEALTGSRPYEGEDVSMTLAAVLSREPEWSQLPNDLPRALHQLFERCLDKDPRQRLQDIGDARWWLSKATREEEDPIAGPTEAQPIAGRSRLIAAGLGIAALALGALLGKWLGAPEETVEAVVSFSDQPGLSLTPGTVGREIAIAPSGRFFVFSAAHTSTSAIYRRDLDHWQPELIEGSLGGHDPFLSPDERWLGFIGPDSKLFRVPIDGGAPEQLTELAPLAPDPTVRAIFSYMRGIVWSGDQILFGTSSGSLYRLPATGGEPELLAPTAGADGGPLRGRYPEVLPDGRILFEIDSTAGQRLSNIGSFDAFALHVYDPSSGATVDLGIQGTAAQYMSDGFLAFMRMDGVWVCPFDLDELQVLDSPVRVIPLEQDRADRAPFAVTLEGTMVVLESEKLSLVEVSADGQRRTFQAEPGLLRHPRWSPDQRRIAYTRGGIGVAQVWIHEVAGGRESRLAETDNNVYPVWTGDDRLVFFQPGEGDLQALRIVPSDRSMEPVTLYESRNVPIPLSVSSRGLVLFTENYDFWWLPLPPPSEEVRASDEERPQARRWLETDARERNGTFSPDGRYVAYDSDETGQREVYLRPFPGPGGATTVSVGGGREPAWSSDGTALYFRAEDSLRAVPVVLGERGIEIGRESVLIEEFEVATYRADRSWDPRPGSTSILTLGDLSPSRMRIVVNWPAQLRARNFAGRAR